MKRNHQDYLQNNIVFIWLFLITLAILAIPYLAMQYQWQLPEPGESRSSMVDWEPEEFVLMGALVFSMSSSFVLVARKISRRKRWIAGLLFLLVFMYFWAELAVGIFTNIGN